MLGGKPVLRWAVEALIRHPAVNALRVVIGEGPAGARGCRARRPRLSAHSSKAATSAPIPSGRSARYRRRRRVWCTTRRGPSVRRRSSTGSSPLEFFEGATPVLPVRRHGRARNGPAERARRSQRASCASRHRRRFVSRLFAKPMPRGQVQRPTDETTVMRAAGMDVAVVAGDPALEKLHHARRFRTRRGMARSRD